MKQIEENLKKSYGTQNPRESVTPLLPESPPLDLSPKPEESDSGFRNLLENKSPVLGTKQGYWDIMLLDLFNLLPKN